MSLTYPLDATRQDVAEGTPDKEPTDSYNLEESMLKNFFNQAFTVADEARRPREVIWKQAWALYMGQYDWTGKADWQSKSNIPKVRGAVDRTAASFRRALIRLRQFYQAESESKLGKEKGLFSIMLLDYWLGQSNFIEEFTTCVKTGLITSMSILKVYWDWTPEKRFDVAKKDEYSPQLEFGIDVGTKVDSKVHLKQYEEVIGKFQVKAVDPFRFWVLPRFRGTAVIEKVEMQMSDIEELASRGIYDKEAVKRLKAKRLEDYTKQQDEARRRGEHLEVSTIFFKPIDIYHYWGDIYDDKGDVVMRNASFTIATKEVVLRWPRKNPFFHGKLPYVWGSPFVVPFSTYHRGLVEDVTGLATMITELSNLVVDGAQFEAAKGFEVDIDMINDRADLRDGIYPGVVLPKRGLQAGPADKKMITPIDTGKVPTEAIAVLGMLNGDFNQSVGTPNIQPDQQKTGARNSATEMQGRSMMAMEGTEDSARTIEEMLINPFLDIAIKTIYQFHDDYTLSRLAENFPQTTSLLRDMSPEERYVTMVGDHHFKARGISLMMDKQQMLSRVVEFMQLAGTVPGMLQRVNMDAFLEEVFNLFGWNPNKFMVQQTPQVATPMQPGGGGPPVPFPNPVTPNAQNPQQAMAGIQGVIYGGAQNNPMAGPQGQPQPTPQGR